jgi:IS1 family transposase
MEFFAANTLKLTFTLDTVKQKGHYHLMNKLSRTERAKILGLMVEGMSLRAISRVTGASKNTVVKLLEDAGEAFSDYQDRTMRNLTCKRIQVDEIWAFVYAKAKNVKTAKTAPEEAGDIWAWMAIDADTKLIPSFYVGSRDADAAQHFISDLARRLANRVQLTSDGHKPYLAAVEQAFGASIDYAMLIKHYGEPVGALGRYSPGECTGIDLRRVEGRPDLAHVSTSYVERANLTTRMGNRRFTRLTNAFSKKAENHAHSVAIHTMHYNFVRIHQTLRCTPAMAAGVSATLWELEDMVRVLEAWEQCRTA